MASIEVSGPLFDGRATVALDSMLDDCRHELAAQASADVHTILNARIQHPTPYYETQITTQDVGSTTVTHDRGIVYGPWLEGVSRRNATTRFKGYAAFRTAAQSAAADAPRLLQPIINRHLRAAQ